MGQEILPFLIEVPEAGLAGMFNFGSKREQNDGASPADLVRAVEELTK